MQREYDLKILTPQLARFGLLKFLEDVTHRNELLKRIVSQQKLGSSLGFDFDTINIYMHSPSNSERNFKMYEKILNVLEDGERDAGKFLLALENSGNEHVIKYIKVKIDENPDGEEVKETTTHENPSASASSAKTPAPSSIAVSMGTKEKATFVLEYLKTESLKEFLESHLVELCDDTKDLKNFIRHLRQLNILSQNDAESFEKRQLTSSDTCEEIYKMAGQEGDGGKLLRALQSTKNGHIVNRMYEWAKW